MVAPLDPARTGPDISASGIISMKLSRSMTVIVASLVTSLAMAAGAPSDGALLITQLNSQQWQLRLVQGGSGQRFNGVIESSAPFAAVSALQPRGSDSVKLWSPSSLGANLSSGAGGVDRLNFTVSDEAQLCLRDTGSSGIQMYRGEQLAGRDSGDGARGAERRGGLR